MILRRLLGLPSKRKPPIDCGNGLRLLPEQATDREDDTGLLIPDWAAQEWVRWESGTGIWFGLDNTTSVCPACFLLASRETAAFMAGAHSDPDARRRWQRHAAKKTAMLAALGPCRCGQCINAGQVAADVQRELGRYRF